MGERPPYRLPRTVVPRRYQLEIMPDKAKGVFHGSAVIAVEVLEPITEMILNAVHLTLDSVVLTNGEGQSVTGTVSYHPEEEQVSLHWPKTVAPGPWTVSMVFDGILATDLRGFYRTTVAGQDGQPIVILATQCEATDARRIFPCWDEPDFKASFQISLVVEPGSTALSNGREVHREELADGQWRVSFADTMLMSTYLVALVVGPLELTPPVMVGSVPVRIAARSGLLHLTDIAKTAAVDTLKFFQEYFGIPYPADKLDHVAIPDFAAGAMENLGCVTYREEALLVDEKRSSATEQMQVVSTIAHETAHMWFGDLVTMRWWNGIWLNEAFATFMQQLATDALHPEWDVWTTFGHGRAHALGVDGLASTRAIEYPVGPPVEAWGMFDVLTYQKGGAILRMLEQYLSPPTFQKGIQGYLNRHRYGNTETSDLWDALETASGEPVRAMMDSWVFQAGYPLVRVTWDHTQNVIHLHQQQFRYLGGGDGQWHIPVVLRVWRANGVLDTMRAIINQASLSLSVPKDAQAVLVNQGAWGFYRVFYDPSLWHPLLDRLDEMTPLERFSLLDDAWALVQANDVALTHIIPLWRALTFDRDPDVWGAISRQLTLLDDLAEPEERHIVREFIGSIAGPVLDELQWDPAPADDVRRRRLRATVIRLLGTVGADAAVRARAREILSAYWQGTIQVAPELLTPLVNVVAASGGETEWEIMYRRFKEAATPQDEKRYLYALAEFSDPDLVRRTLHLYYSSEVRVQDGAFALGHALANRHARREAWKMLEDHWDEILAKYPKMVEYIVSPLTSVVEDDLADRTVAWLKDHPVPGVERHIAQTLEMQAVNRALARRICGQLAQALRGQ